VPPTDGNERAPADQRLKKPRRSSAVADNTKHNVSEIRMFFLNKPNMKALEIFPNGMTQLVCVDLHARVVSVLGRIVLSCTPGRLVI